MLRATDKEIRSIPLLVWVRARREVFRGWREWCHHRQAPRGFLSENVCVYKIYIGGFRDLVRKKVSPNSVTAFTKQ